MKRLVIADDEKIIRETVSTIIDWKSLGIEVVALCKNGLEAYDAIVDLYPDIVLTDISMPKLTGLDLISRITSTRDNIQFVILSGYNDFSYAKEAMKYGVRYYLLKPCNEQEIVDAVGNAIKDHEKAIEQNSIETELASSKIRLKKSLIADILVKALSSESDVKTLPELYDTYIDFYELPFELDFLYYVEEEKARHYIKRLMEFTESKYPDSQLSFIYVRNTLSIFYPKTSDEMDDAIHTVLLNEINNQKDNVSELSTNFYTCFNDMLEVLIPKVKRFETILLYTDKTATPICKYDYFFKKVIEYSDKLLSDIDESSYNACISEIHELLSGVEDTELLRSLISHFLLKAIDNSNNSDFYEVTSILEYIGNINSNDEIRKCLFEKLPKVYPINVVKKRYKSFVEEIITYTKEHLSDPNITLKWIIENHLYMNVNYVSHQFVLETGQKYSTFLNELRIEKAKKLLLSGDEKLYQIAEQIGCGNNPQYFSHLFKKYTKMTPSEFIAMAKKG